MPMAHARNPSIVIVDDEVGILRGLSDLFQREGFTVYATENMEDALRIADTYNLSVAVIDIRLKNNILGTELLAALKKRDPDLPVIMITGFGSIESAVDAMRQGAADYILKPIDNAHILDIVRKNIQLVRLKNDNLYLHHELRDNFYSHEIVTEDPKVLELLELADRVKNSRVPVLLSGESGTGKEIMARYIHFSSNRKDNPFVCVNCAALSESLLLSELFGHEKGSFTGAVEKRVGKFELADRGTLFLDEIGDMSPNVQAKMLRVLEESSFERVGGTRSIAVDIRIITATNKHMPELIASGRFREDLFYRINVVNLDLPPLRERSKDIPLLVDHFIGKYNKRYNKAVSGVTREVLGTWERYKWPGNIRELQNIINQAVLLSTGPLIESPGMCAGTQPYGQDVAGFNPEKHGSLKEYVRGTTARLEKSIIEHALASNRYNRSKTAKELQITRKTLAKKITDLQIPLDV